MNKKNRSAVSFFLCTVLLATTISIPVLANQPDAETYAVVSCRSCKSRDITLVNNERGFEVNRWTVPQCANTYYPVAHDHCIVKYYDDYQCNKCGEMMSVYVRQQEFCQFGNMSKIDNEVEQ